eukprot:6188371-Pleurochrysis_carterae.AAC.2
MQNYATTPFSVPPDASSLSRLSSQLFCARARSFASFASLALSLPIAPSRWGCRLTESVVIPKQAVVHETPPVGLRPVVSRRVVRRAAPQAKIRDDEHTRSEDMAAEECTVLLCTPESVKRNVAFEAAERFESRGLSLVGCAMITASQEQAENQYKSIADEQARRTI